LLIKKDLLDSMDQNKWEDLVIRLVNSLRRREDIIELICKNYPSHSKIEIINNVDKAIENLINEGKIHIKSNLRIIDLTR